MNKAHSPVEIRICTHVKLCDYDLVVLFDICREISQSKLPITHLICNSPDKDLCDYLNNCCRILLPNVKLETKSFVRRSELNQLNVIMCESCDKRKVANFLIKQMKVLEQGKIVLYEIKKSTKDKRGDTGRIDRLLNA